MALSKPKKRRRRERPSGLRPGGIKKILSAKPIRIYCLEIAFGGGGPGRGSEGVSAGFAEPKLGVKQRRASVDDIMQIAVDVSIFGLGK